MLRFVANALKCRKASSNPLRAPKYWSNTRAAPMGTRFTNGINQMDKLRWLPIVDAF